MGELDNIVKRVLETYYKGELSLADAVEVECKRYKEELLQAVNQFEHASKKKVAEENATEEKVMYDRLVETTICPANGENVEIFRGVCQGWNNIIELCFQGACSKYPVLHKAPVVSTELEPKKKSFVISGKEGTVDVHADLENGKVTIGDKEIILEGKTFGAKLREMRDKLAGVLGIHKVCEIINKLSGEKKIAKREDVINGATVWLKKSAYVGDGDVMMWGVVVAVDKKDDGSELIVIRDGKKEGYIIGRSDILKVSTACKFYRVDTGQCRKGCTMEGVAPSNMCPFVEDEQFDCRCCEVKR